MEIEPYILMLKRIRNTSRKCLFFQMGHGKYLSLLRVIRSQSGMGGHEAFDDPPAVETGKRVL
jgi:hypothetical protein